MARGLIFTDCYFFFSQSFSVRRNVSFSSYHRKFKRLFFLFFFFLEDFERTYQMVDTCHFHSCGQISTYLSCQRRDLVAAMVQCYPTSGLFSHYNFIIFFPFFSFLKNVLKVWKIIWSYKFKNLRIWNFNAWNFWESKSMKIQKY